MGKDYNRNIGMKALMKGFKMMLLFVLIGSIFYFDKTGVREVNAEDNPLTVTEMKEIFVPAGAYRDFAFKVKNTSSAPVTGIDIIYSTILTNPNGDKCTPYDFQYSNRTGSDKCPDPVNATKDDKGYTIQPGVTATFYMRVYSYSFRAVGTYNDYIQLGRQHRELVYEYDPATNMTSIGYKDIIEAEYTGHVAVKTTLYNPANDTLIVGTSANNGFDITPFGSTIDFGTINLATAGENKLKQEKFFYAKNTSPQGLDEHDFSRDITVSMDLDTDNMYDYLNSCFTFDDNLLNGMHWAPLPPAQANSYETASGNILLDTTYFIAGTYTTNLIVNTIPFGAKVNGSATQTKGDHLIPVKVTLTGTNPRLPSRVTDLIARPGDNQVELTWSAPKEGLTYSVYRREGNDSTNPDSWKDSDWKKYEELSCGEVYPRSDGTYMFVDGTAKNGKTYSYTVIAGHPYKGYAAKPVSATPKNTYISRLQCPESIYVDETIGGVNLEWELNGSYGGKFSSGESMVDHFNIYRDGVLVAQVMQNSVIEDISYDWIDQGDGNLNWGISSRQYSWETFIETPKLGQMYTFNIAAVSKSGLEGYLSEDIQGFGVPEVLKIVSHSATYNSEYYNEKTGRYVPAISVTAGLLSYGDVEDSIKVWRAEGTTAPDTSKASYNPAISERKSFVDLNVVAGKTYNYTFSVKALDNIDSSTPEIDFKVIDGKKISLSWYGDYYVAYDSKDQPYYVYSASYKLYCNNTLVGTYSNKESYTYENNPGKDGTYVYRVDKITGGLTIRGKEYTFVRDTSIVDDDTFLKVPGAPSLSVRISDSKAVLTWSNSRSGGKPSGYHIYRKDAGEYVERGRNYRVTPWSRPYYRMWGNHRYLTISDPDTGYFIDGKSFYYNDDPELGELESIDWRAEYCPHEYWITAYNSAGESAPSKVYSFDCIPGEDNYTVAPGNTDTAAPGKPTITDIRVEWKDDSQDFLEWCDIYDGEVRIAWKDSDLGGGIDKYNVYTSGTCYSNENGDKRTIYYSDVIADPDLKKGKSDYFGHYGPSLNAEFGENGDYGRTIKMKIGAENGEGETLSDEVSVKVYSIPLFRALPGNSSVKLEWTDLYNDTSTTVTRWEIYKKHQFGYWQLLKSYKANEITYSAQDRNGVKNYVYRDTDVENGWEYSYKLVAICADGVNRTGNIRTVTPSPSSASDAPGVPADFKAEVLNGEILFTWKKSTSGGEPIYYTIEELLTNSYSGEQYWSSIGEVSAPSTAWVYTPDDPGTKKFRIYAFNNENTYYTLTSEYSAPISVTLTQAQINSRAKDYPAKPVISAVAGDYYITLNWTYDTSEGTVPTYYEIYRYGSQQSTIKKVTISGKGTRFTYTDTDVEPDVRYLYEIYSYNTAGSNLAEIYAAATGDTKDKRVADKVNALIKTLPAPDKVTLADEDNINTVKTCYNSLTKKQKKLIDSDLVDKLNKCVARIEFLILYDKYADIIDPVQALINALPAATAVTTADEPQIQAARDAYEAMIPREAMKAVDTLKLVAAENAIRNIRYNVALHGSLTISGKWTIGTEERPTIKAFMYNTEMTSDQYRIGYVRDGSTVVNSSVYRSGNYRVVLIGKSPFFGRVISKEFLKVYDVNDILDNAKFSGNGEYAYTGKPIVLNFKVNVNGQWLERDVDYYIVAYYRINADGSATKIEAKDVVNIGKYYVELKPVDGGFYTGSVKYYFAVMRKEDMTDPSQAGDDAVDFSGRGKDGTEVGEGADADVAEKAITSSTSDEGPAGTRFSPLMLKSTKQTKNSIKLSWKKAKGATKYVLYGNLTGKKNKMVKITTSKKTSVTVKKIKKKKLKKGTYYKFILVAIDKNNKVVSTSKTAYVVTSGGKYCNYKKVTTKAKKDKVTIKKKKKYKLGAKMKKASSKKKVKKLRGLSYESSNTKIATVSKKGVIKGIKKGTCYIYVYTQDGISRKIKVKVK